MYGYPGDYYAGGNSSTSYDGNNGASGNDMKLRPILELPSDIEVQEISSGVYDIK